MAHCTLFQIVDETFKSVDRKIEKQYRLTVQLQREVTTMPSLLLAVRDMASRIGTVLWSVGVFLTFSIVIYLAI